MFDNYILKFDGAITKNPGGIGSYGVVLYLNNNRIIALADIIHDVYPMTNNVAEHYALMKGLDYCLNHVCIDNKSRIIHVLGDSQLVINQMTKKYKAKSHMPYYPFYAKNIELAKKLRKLNVMLSFQWIDRENNDECDALSKEYREKAKNNFELALDKDHTA